MLDLRGIVGAPVSRLRSRLGPPAADRSAGGDRWMVFETAEITLRVRCEAGAEGGADAAIDPEPRVASWSARFSEGRRTLREAAAALGLWPGCAPDREVAAAETPLLRRALPDPGGDAVHSLTASVRGGRIVQVTAFDEPPDWL